MDQNNYNYLLDTRHSCVNQTYLHLQFFGCVPDMFKKYAQKAISYYS